MTDPRFALSFTIATSTGHGDYEVLLAVYGSDMVDVPPLVTAFLDAPPHVGQIVNVNGQPVELTEETETPSVWKARRVRQ
jgi:hypothetical protein